MNLVVDIGNTQTKLAVFNKHHLLQQQFAKTENLSEELSKILKHFTVLNSIISSVVDPLPQVEKLLSSNSNLLKFSSNTPVPLKNEYLSPETLGLDRLANAIALSHLFPNQNALSIDIGTCIKYDFKSKTNTYLGGGISPGLNMRYKSLHDFTAKLPLLTPIENSPLVGATTNESIHSGVLWGVINEIEGTISKYQLQYSDLIIVMTGGDHVHFAKALKNSIFARPNLTLEGLNEVLIFNE